VEPWRRPWVLGPVYTTCWASPSYVEALVGPASGDSEELEVEAMAVPPLV
jgi:hypothetical protein